jgi:hypothetical protein
MGIGKGKNLEEGHVEIGAGAEIVLFLFWRWSVGTREWVGL